MLKEIFILLIVISNILCYIIFEKSDLIHNENERRLLMDAILNLSGNLFEQTEALSDTKSGFSSTVDLECMTLTDTCYSLDTYCTVGCHP